MIQTLADILFWPLYVVWLVAAWKKWYGWSIALCVPLAAIEFVEKQWVAMALFLAIIPFEIWVTVRARRRQHSEECGCLGDDKTEDDDEDLPY